MHAHMHACMYYKNRLVILTAECLSWLHGLLATKGYSYIRQPVSLLFLDSFSSFWNREKSRKQQGNYLWFFVQLASDTKIGHATRVTALWLEQPNCFYSMHACMVSGSYHLLSQDEINGFHCECAPGYNGTICEHNINDCEPDPCVHGQCMVI